MQLGAFSISLTVKDLSASRAFYEKLGFGVFGGDQHENWLIMKNGDALIGLFQGMFEKNVLTFNPGWDTDANEISEFPSVRELAAELAAQGVEVVGDLPASGPGSFTVIDPDGNPILIDQHRD